MKRSVGPKVRVVAMVLGAAGCLSCSQQTESRLPLSVPETPAPAPAPAVVPDPESVSPWKTLYQEARSRALDRWPEPELGGPMEIQLKSGAQKKGRLRGVTPEAVVLEIESGVIEYPRAGLSDRSRARLYAEDYAHLLAQHEVREARRDEAMRRAAEATEMAEAVASAETPAPPRASVSGPAGPPVNHSSDGSVWQVKDHLQRTLKNPESIEYISWSNVMQDDTQYRVVCSYRAEAGSFGLVTEKKVFFMNEAGQITMVSAVRPDPETLR